MAKYTVTFSCGHEGTVELFGKTAEREKKIDYFEKNGLCHECYKKKMEEASKAEGLVFNASILPRVASSDGSYLLNVWFSGDTKPCKDSIKAMGYRWSELETTTESMLSANSSLFWNKVVKADDVKVEVEAAQKLGVTTFRVSQKFWNKVDCQIAAKAKKEWEEKHEKMEGLQKPEPPTIIKGCKWNGVIYGKAGNYSIYPNGKKTSITDDDADELKAYLRKKEEYLQKVKEIET